MDPSVALLIETPLATSSSFDPLGSDLTIRNGPECDRSKESGSKKSGNVPSLASECGCDLWTCPLRRNPMERDSSREPAEASASHAPPGETSAAATHCLFPPDSRERDALGLRWG